MGNIFIFKGTYGPNSLACLEKNGKAESPNYFKAVFHKLRLLYSTSPLTGVTLSFLYVV